MNSNYLKKDPKLKSSPHGTLGQKLYANAQRNLTSEGGLDYLIELASQQRPEILEHWQYDLKKVRRKNNSLKSRISIKRSF